MPTIGIVIGYGMVFLAAKYILWPSLDNYTQLHLILGVIGGLWFLGHGTASFKNKEYFSDIGIITKRFLYGFISGILIMVLFGALCQITIHKLGGPWWLAAVYGIGLLVISPFLIVAFIDHHEDGSNKTPKRTQCLSRSRRPHV